MFCRESAKKGNELLVFCAAIFAPSPALLPALMESLTIRAESVPLAKNTIEWVLIHLFVLSNCTLTNL
jgi:hypothetical protein